MSAFVVPVARHASGGHRYNADAVAHWPGTPPEFIEIPGPWPAGDDAGRAALADALARHPATLVDGLVGAAHPDLVAAATAAGRRTVLLVHMPLADEGGLPASEAARLDALERRTVHAASRVVATSRTAAASLARRHRRAGVRVAPPGVTPAPVADVHDPPHLLAVGAIGPRKNQRALVRALAGLTDLPWHATIVGPVVDDAYAVAVADAAPPGRVRWTGELGGPELDAVWAGGDLLVHPSLAETWGMVVTEALARGIPAVVGSGTGAVEALASGSPDGPPPGASVAPGELAGVLRTWLADAGLRAEWRDRALDARPRLGSWADTAAALAEALEGP